MKAKQQYLLSIQTMISFQEFNEFKYVVGDLGIVLVIECILSGFQSKLSRIPNFLKHFLQLATQPWTLPKTCHKGESKYDHQWGVKTAGVG